MKIAINQTQCYPAKSEKIYQDFVVQYQLQNIAFDSSVNPDVLIITFNDNKFRQLRTEKCENPLFWNAIDKFKRGQYKLMFLAYKKVNSDKYSFYHPHFFKDGIEGLANSSIDSYVDGLKNKIISKELENHKKVELKEYKPILNQYEIETLLEGHSKVVPCNTNDIVDSFLGDPIYSSKHNVINNHSLMLLII